MDIALQNALAEEARLKEALIRVQQFIETHKALTAGLPVPVRQRYAVPRITVTGRPKEAREQIAAAMRRVGRPMSSKEIVQNCRENGYEMPGQIPTTYVTLIVHRNQDVFERDRINRTYYLRAQFLRNDIEQAAA